jgi:hypothetical protein
MFQIIFLKKQPTHFSAHKPQPLDNILKNIIMLSIISHNSQRMSSE